MPDPNPWAVPAYHHFWGAGATGTPTLIRAMQGWHERYGAQPYAATGVTLHFVVERPIDNIFDALDVAAEHLPFSEMDDLLRRYGRALFHAGFWTLYDRP